MTDEKEEKISLIAETEAERVTLWAEVDEVQSKIQKKLAALLEHPLVPEVFKNQFEKGS